MLCLSEYKVGAGMNFTTPLNGPVIFFGPKLRAASAASFGEPRSMASSMIRMVPMQIRLAENLNLGIRSEHLQITISARQTAVARGR